MNGKDEGTSREGIRHDARIPDGFVTDEHAADGTAADGKAADGTAADGKAADGTAADGKAADGKPLAAHRSLADIIAMALELAPDAHVKGCLYCRAAYEDAVELVLYEDAEFEEAPLEEEPAGQWRGYRLAAQDSEHLVADAHVRRTWYLMSGEAVLRVMEDAGHDRLYGHLICDYERYPDANIRFSGIDADFRPGPDGVFDIGAASIEIECMNVTMTTD